MTAQLDDTFIWQERRLAILERTDRSLFNPEKFGLRVGSAMRTDCWDSHFAAFHVDEEQLYMHELNIGYQGLNEFQEFGGVMPIPGSDDSDSEMGFVLYRNFRVPLSFTGGLLIGEGYIPGGVGTRFDNYQNVIELSFSEGRLSHRQNVSTAVRAFRNATLSSVILTSKDPEFQSARDAHLGMLRNQYPRIHKLRSVCSGKLTMPTGGHSFKCAKCSQDWRVSFRFRRYEGNDQPKHRITRGVAWCRNCGEPQDVEDLPKRETLKTIRAEIESGSCPLGEYHARGFMDEKEYSKEKAEMLHDIDLEIHFIESRKSKARCLDCASTEIEYIWRPREWMEMVTTWYEILIDNLEHDQRNLEVAEVVAKFPDYDYEEVVLETFQHPGCGGQIKSSGGMLVNNRAWTEVYSSEGIYLGHDGPGGMEKK